MKLLARLRLRHFSLWLVFLLILVAPALSGCSADRPGLKMAPMSGMPSWVQTVPTTVQTAYQFAVANPEAVKNVPCYCGCGAAGHTSNYSCYVQDVKSSGELVFDQHALGCSICVDITQDVMKMTQAGKTPREIRAAIDSTYSRYGPSNMAPVQ